MLRLSHLRTLVFAGHQHYLTFRDGQVSRHSSQVLCPKQILLLDLVLLDHFNLLLQMILGDCLRVLLLLQIKLRSHFLCEVQRPRA